MYSNSEMYAQMDDWTLIEKAKYLRDERDAIEREMLEVGDDNSDRLNELLLKADLILDFVGRLEKEIT